MDKVVPNQITQGEHEYQLRKTELKIPIRAATVDDLQAAGLPATEAELVGVLVQLDNATQSKLRKATLKNRKAVFEQLLQELVTQYTNKTLERQHPREHRRLFQAYGSHTPGIDSTRLERLLDLKRLSFR